MRRTFDGSGGEKDALKTYLKFIRASEAVLSTTRKHLADERLTASQFSVLEALYHLGPLNQREIAGKICKSHGNVTLIVTNLERRSLIKRQRRLNDRRHYSLDLTPPGLTLVEKIFPQHAAGIVLSLSPLTRAEQHEFARLCRKLGKK